MEVRPTLLRRLSVSSNSSLESSQTEACSQQTVEDETTVTSDVSNTTERSFVRRLSVQLNNAFTWFEDEEDSFEQGGELHSTLALRAVIEKDRRRRQSISDDQECGVADEFAARLERIRAEAKEEASGKQRQMPALVAEWRKVLLGLRPRESARVEKMASALAVHSAKLMDDDRRQILRTSHPLHEAAKKGDLEMTQLLLRVGFDMAAVDNRGFTAADWAQCFDQDASHKDVLKTLGAEPIDVVSI